MRLLPLLLAACTTNPNGDGAPDPNLLVSLEVEPAEVTLVTGPDGFDTEQFTAWANLEDGSRVELEVAEWTVSNSSAGSVDEEGLFTPADDNGGITWVTAEYANTWASSTVTVIYHEELTEGTADASLFQGAESDLGSNPWLYPEDRVRLPRGTPSIHFQWDDLQADAYRLHFESEVSDIVVYTEDFGWESQAALWQVIASTNAAGSVDVTLSASVGGEVLQAEPIQLLVNRMDTRGTIYYWTSTTKGVSRIDENAEAENWWAEGDMDGWCVGCHAVSTGDTPLLAYTAHPTNWEWDPSNPYPGRTEIRLLSDPTQTIVTIDYDQMGDFKSFSPDGELLITAYNCQLLLYDARAGVFIADVSPADPDGGQMCVAQAEFSPDGTQVAMTVSDSISTSWEIHDGALYMMDYLGDHSFSEPELLVDPDDLFDDGQHIAYYPAWSPDGAWIAFNTSTGDSYDDDDAWLWVVSAEGGSPVSLDKANLSEGLTNSWPRWSPLPDDDILWVTFSSKRDYGYQAVEGNPQVWVASFDPSLAEQGLDPSSPAFWLVGQNIRENNHVPVWVE